MNRFALFVFEVVQAGAIQRGFGPNACIIEALESPSSTAGIIKLKSEKP